MFDEKLLTSHVLSYDEEEQENIVEPDADLETEEKEGDDEEEEGEEIE